MSARGPVPPRDPDTEPVASTFSPSTHAQPRPETHPIRDLGFTMHADGDRLVGHAAVTPAILIPGTETVRISVLATWVDILAGLLTARNVQPRVPVTLDLDVDLYEQPTGLGEVRAVGQIVKAGDTATVGVVDLHDETGRRFGHGTATFMVTRIPGFEFTNVEEIIGLMGESHPPTDVPFAEHAGCEVRAPGVTEMAFTPERANASGSLNGGLLALMVEEAALSARPGTPLGSMSLRYLRALRVGPAVATAVAHGAVTDVVVTDEGREDVLAVFATTRTHAADAVDETEDDTRSAIADAVSPPPHWTDRPFDAEAASS